MANAAGGMCIAVTGGHGGFPSGGMGVDTYAFLMTLDAVGRGALIVAAGARQNVSAGFSAVRPPSSSQPGVAVGMWVVGAGAIQVHAGAYAVAVVTRRTVRNTVAFLAVCRVGPTLNGVSR